MFSSLLAAAPVKNEWYWVGNLQPIGNRLLRLLYKTGFPEMLNSPLLIDQGTAVPLSGDWAISIDQDPVG